LTRNKRRHLTGFGYIGFGNNQNIFNQKSRKAFSELKTNFNEKTQKHYQCHFLHESLTKEAKAHIKNTIRKEEKARNRNILLVFILSIIPLAFLIKYLIDSFIDHF